MLELADHRLEQGLVPPFVFDDKVKQEFDVRVVTPLSQVLAVSEVVGLSAGVRLQGAKQAF
jgi:hypothetical protein